MLTCARSVMFPTKTVTGGPVGMSEAGPGPAGPGPGPDPGGGPLIPGGGPRKEGGRILGGGWDSGGGIMPNPGMGGGIPGGIPGLGGKAMRRKWIPRWWQWPTASLGAVGRARGWRVRRAETTEVVCLCLLRHESRSFQSGRGGKCSKTRP